MAQATEEIRRVRSDRVPPHNLDAEDSVLGAMMLSSDAIADVIEILKPDEFYRLVESLCPGSKLEMFSREKREGWVGHGNESR